MSEHPSSQPGLPPGHDDGPPWRSLIAIIVVPAVLLIALTVALLLLPPPV